MDCGVEQAKQNGHGDGDAAEWKMVAELRAVVEAQDPAAKVIPMATHWIRMWSWLQKEEQRKDMDSGCTRLEMVAQDLCSRFGWRPVARINI